MSKRIFLALWVGVLALSACNIRVPPVKTPGPDVITKISIDSPKADAANLKLAFGTGELTVLPAAQSQLVTGTATYNVPDLKPVITSDSANVSLKEGDYTLGSAPVLSGVKNQWNLNLGNTPLNLSVEAGAYKGNFDFGGLSLLNLSVSDGAAQTTVDFSTPNKTRMSVFSYKTGASNVTLKDLANANAATIVFESGAGNYKLDFGGTLQDDTSATIRTGLSNLTLIIPKGLAATVNVSNGLSNVQFPDGWAQNNDTYTQEGSGPQLTIVVEMGAGNLQVTQ